jgi:hypothetical protein
VTKLLLLNYNSKGNHQDREQGLSLIEIIASTLMGMIILSFALGGFISMRQSFVVDKGDGDVNQRLRTIFANMGPDIQQLGQGLTNTSVPLPLVEITKNNTTNSSEIILRRLTIPQSLTLCEDVAPGTSDSMKVFDKNVTDCVQVGDVDTIDAQGNTDGWPDVVKLWRDQRINQIGTTLRAYIYNPNNPAVNEFFDYSGEIPDVNPVASKRPNPPTTATVPNTVILKNSFVNNFYPKGSMIYLVDERKYEVKDNTLTLTINGTNPLKLVEFVEKLEILATIRSLDSNDNEFFSECTGILDGVTPIDCDVTPIDYQFKNITSIDVRATVLEQGKTDPLSNNNPDPNLDREKEDFSLSQKFFPRNTI